MIIGISGKMGSGKDTLAEMLMDLMPSLEHKSFAHKLKVICAILTGCNVEDFESQEFKKSKLPKEWDDSEGIDTYRDLLLVVGTDCMREMVHNNIWVNALFADYRPVDPEKAAWNGTVVDYSDCTWPDWIITDCRFKNEAQAIREKGGILIRINRDIERANTTHASETDLDDWTDWDHVIDNNGTLVDLQMQALKIHNAITHGRK